MSLAAGTSLGPYEILEPIGAGGMGEVYRARDTKLDRDVAIKVLPEELAADEERVARFEREAKLLASLNHPNIASIYGFEAGALVLELVEGPTLAERIALGPIPVEEAIAIAKQIAEALEAGHEAGVIHRDLKPANIKVREDGTVKVLDYGLAKAVEGEVASGADSELSQSPTLTRQGTQIGVILGTAAYMSPEQAKGKRVDKRTDVWAFGCVVYEMLTGKRAFGGEDVSETLAAVIRAEPDLGALPDELSPTLREYLSRCLEKDAKQRVHDAADLRLALEGAFDVPPAPPVGHKPSSSYLAAAAVVALVVGALFGRSWWSATSVVPPGNLTQLTLDLGEGRILSGGFAMEQDLRLGLQRPSRRSFALSPDGRDLVFTALVEDTPRLFRRSMNQADAVPLADTEGGSKPFFSPDGEFVAFFVENELKRLSLATGEVRTLTTSGPEFEPARGASWTVNDTILLASRDDIYEVPANGGSLRRVTADAAPGARVSFPELLPGEAALLLTEYMGNRSSDGNIIVEELETGERRVVVEGGSDARYLASGHLVFMRAGSLMAVAFDARRLEILGTPIVVIENVMHAERGPNGNLNSDVGQFHLSHSGVLAYVPGDIYPTRVTELVWVDRAGESEPLPLPPGNYYSPNLSPNLTRLAFHGGTIGDDELRVFDFAHQTSVTLTRGGFLRNMVWSPDGSRLAFGRGAADGEIQIYTMAADGGEEPERLITSELTQFPASWSRDGILAFVQGDPRGGWDIWTYSTVRENETPEPFLETPFYEAWPSFSPDGRWLAYASNETGRTEVYVRPFPEGVPVHRVSADGGSAPLWSRDGRQLYFRRSGEDRFRGILVVDVTTDGGFQRSQPRTVFENDKYRGTGPVRSYDLAPDGERFVMVTAGSIEQQPVSSIRVVLNWTEELKRLVPTDD